MLPPRQWAIVILLCACTDEAAPSVPVEAPQEALAPTVDEPPETPPAEVLRPPINLLEALETAVAVSSVYRGHATEVIRMVDGDIETAWNSDSGDLVGAWVDVRVPPDASVTGARLIVGFTHESGGRDLFTANPRITEVRILRDGVALGEFALDPSVRELQPIDFEGVGGTYRFEVTDVLAGSNAEWREICISELQLLGRSESAGTGHVPQTSVGRLPPERHPDP